MQPLCFIELRLPSHSKRQLASTSPAALPIGFLSKKPMKYSNTHEKGYNKLKGVVMLT